MLGGKPASVKPACGVALRPPRRAASGKQACRAPVSRASAELKIYWEMYAKG